MVKKNLVLFAGYSKKRQVDLYILHYLKELNQYADIIYIADNTLPHNETVKIKPYIIHSICTHHGEYDFGSYKRGLQYAQDNGFLLNYQHLILCNDSAVPYQFDFEKVMHQFSDSRKEYGGMYYNKALTNPEIKPHLQSYFLIFNRHIFSNTLFLSFFRTVKKWDNKKDIVKHSEIALSSLLFSMDDDFFSYLSRNEDLTDTSQFLDLLDEGFPFIKKKLFNFSRMKYDLAYVVLKFIKNQLKNRQETILLITDCILKNGTHFDRLVLILPLKMSLFLLILKNKIGFVYKSLRSKV